MGLEALRTLDATALLLAGGVMVALAAGLLALRFGDRVNRALALFLVLRGVMNLHLALLSDPGTADLARRIAPYYALAVPFAAVGFAHAYRSRRGAGPSRRVPWLLLGGALVLEALYLRDHGLWGTPGAFGPLLVVDGLNLLVYALLALLFADDYVRAPPGPRRRAHLLLALGFSLDSLYWASLILVGPLEALFRPPGTWLPFEAIFGIQPASASRPPSDYPALLALLPLALLALRLARFGARSGDATVRREVLWVLPLLAAPACSAVFIASLAAFPAGRDVAVVAFDGLWTLALPVLLSYALVRHQLFDIEVRVKRGTAAAFVVALGVGAYALLAGLLDALLGPLGLGGAAPQALAAGIVVLAATRVRRVARAVADALFPGVREDDPAYLQHRRLQVYHAALEASAQEGRGAAEDEALRALRGALGVSEREHALLLAEVQGVSPARALAEGALFLGRYRVVRRLGQGAHGEVFLARDEQLGREVVLKRLLGGRLRDAAALERFQREIRLASALHHPHVVTVYDVEVVGEAAYLVMEHAAGGSLAERLREHGPLGEEEVRRLGLDLLDALGALHRRGIVHRDVKPSNVLLDAQGRGKLGDFGIAQDVVSGDTAGATGLGPVPGTLGSMAPEQARGLPAEPRSDLYSLAATLYEALAGRPPVDVEGLADFEARLRVAQGGPALPLPGVSPAMNETLARGLAKAPEERFPDAAAMHAALRAPGARRGQGAAPARGNAIGGESPGDPGGQTRPWSS